MRTTFEKFGKFHKVDGDTAYGWAFVSTINGVPYFDTGDGKHSDHIPESSIDEVASAFMKSSRAGLEMHTGERVADVLFAYPMTDAIMKGVDIQSAKTGLLIGWQPYDKSLLEKIADGERLGFSIGGLVESWDIVDLDGSVIESVNLADKSAHRIGNIAKAAGYDGRDGKMKRRVFRSWKLEEISLVDRPMQEPALVGVVKSAGGAVSFRKVYTIARAFSKGSILTSNVDGHQHVIDPACCDESGMGRTSYERSSGDEYGHDHAFVRKPDGTVEIAANSGHDHTATVPVMADGAPAGTTVAMRAQAENSTAPIPPSSVASKSQPEPTETKTMPMTEAEIEALKKAHAHAVKLAELNDAHRAYAKTLSSSEAEAFVAKSATDRDAIVKSAIAYTAQDGTVFYAGDDARLIKSAKDNDELKKSLATEQALRKRAEFSKAATENMGSYPESGDVHVAIVEAVSGIADEATRTAAMTAIKAGNAALAKASVPTGTVGARNTVPGGSSDELMKAEGELRTAVDAYATANKIGHYQLALAEATAKDPATRAAFDKVAKLRRQAN